MPIPPDLESILILGSGPIIIGQAAEFDHSGTQAVQALREEGYRVILVASNPATIMTAPDLADATYIELIIPEWVERVIEKEKARRRRYPALTRPSRAKPMRPASRSIMERSSSTSSGSSVMSSSTFTSPSIAAREAIRA